MVRMQPDTGADDTAAAGTARRPFGHSGLPVPGDWRKRMSNHVAYALLVYTALQIFVTLGALEGARGSILPCLALIALVAAIIPACRCWERRWRGLGERAAHDPAMAAPFRRDCAGLWLLAIGVPLGLTLLLKALALAFGH